LEGVEAAAAVVAGVAVADEPAEESVGAAVNVTP